MWNLITWAGRATGLGSIAVTIILIVASVASISGTYILWKRSVIAERDQYWEARMQREKERIEKIISEEGRKSAERVAVIEKTNEKLLEQIAADEDKDRNDPDANSIILDADSVRDIDNIR